MAQVGVSNLLDGDVPGRCLVEEVIHSMLGPLPDGPLSVTLSRSVAPGRIAIDIRLPSGGMVFMSVSFTDTRDEVEARLRHFVDSR